MLRNVLFARFTGQFRLLACVALLLGLNACGSHPTHRSATRYNPSRYYPPPGTSADPWGPYIHEASGRFGVPELWIRRVMRQESGGQEDVISWAGAMGLMQVMPETYDGLRGRYSLGDDPFDPHNNILAGTAYLREMYDRFGSPGFLAAYNAGPNRLDRYLNSGTPLPAETVNYVASIAPLLGEGTPMSGPLAVYAMNSRSYAPSRVASRPTPAGCDPDAAYNPDGPCTPMAAPVVVATYTPPAAAVSQTAAFCDPDAAYDPAGRCRPAPPAVVASQATEICDSDAAYDPSRRCRLAPAVITAQPIQPPPSAPPLRFAAEARPIQERMAQPVAFSPGPPRGHWMIQVGAFATLTTAEAAAERARSTAPDLLGTAKIVLPATAPLGNQVAFRARLSELSASAAADACARLTARGTACITVPPARDSF